MSEDRRPSSQRSSHQVAPPRLLLGHLNGTHAVTKPVRSASPRHHECASRLSRHDAPARRHKQDRLAPPTDPAVLAE
jgi:hypothetical protein